MTDADPSMTPSCRLDDPQHPFVDGAPKNCHSCSHALCLRQQVINLALGNTDEMLCLSCLAKDNDQSQDVLLTRVKHYIQKRECFAKEWARYSSQQYCPYLQSCVPAACFSD